MKKTIWLSYLALISLLFCLSQADNVQAHLSRDQDSHNSTKPPVVMAISGNGNCQKTGWFYVGNRQQICDPNGKTFVPIGTNMMPHYAGEPMLEDEPGEVMSMANLSKLKTWKFNTVRLNLFVKGLGINPPITKITNYIKRLRSLGMVVILEAHDYTGKFPDAAEAKQLIEWHRQIINVAKNDPYVWLNIMNEPGADNSASTRQQWRDIHIQIVDALHQTDPNRMLLVDVPFYGLDDPDTADFAQSSLLQYGKAIQRRDRHLLFSLHTWWGWNKAAEPKLNRYLDKTRAAGLPLIIGEFGNWPQDQLPAKSPTMPAARASIKVGQQRGVGRLVWEWFGDSDNFLVTEPAKRAFLINSSTQPTNLTELGKLVWQDSHSTQKL